MTLVEDDIVAVLVPLLEKAGWDKTALLLVVDGGKIQLAVYGDRVQAAVAASIASRRLMGANLASEVGELTVMRQPVGKQ